MKRKNIRNLALNAPPRSITPSAGDAQIPGAIGNNSDRVDTLEIGVEFRLDLRAEDLIVLKELGSGNGGTVSKVQHAATKVIMARKVGLPSKACAYKQRGANGCVDHTRGGEEGHTEADSKGATDYARVQLAIHCLFLRRFHE